MSRRLEEQQVEFIRVLWDRYKVDRMLMAQYFGVHESVIGKIVRRETYKGAGG